MLNQRSNGNPLNFRDRSARVGDVDICCVLYQSKEGETWYATEEGGAVRIKHSGANDPLIDPNAIGSVLHLPGAQDVADFVCASINSHFQTHDKQLLLFDGAYQPLAAVSLYQGYFRPSDSEEMRSTVVTTLVQTLRELGWQSPWNGFTTLVYELLLDQGMTPLNWYFLQHLPTGVAGRLAAHGLRFKNLWEYRYKEVMTAGWKYQLDHPTEEFGTTWPDVGTSFFGPIIENVTDDFVADLVRDTGLDLPQIERARVTAIGVAGDDAHLYSKLLLMLLSSAANGKNDATTHHFNSLPTDLAP